MSNSWQTRKTLLDRAKDPNNEEAWADFVAFYTPFIRIVLRQANFPADGMDDASQEIIIRVWKYLKSFDPAAHKVNFRTWLSQVVRNSAYDYYRQHGKYQKQLAAQLESQELAQSSETELERIVAGEWERYLVETAMANVKKVFSGMAVEVFQQSLLGKSSKEIGDNLGISQASARTLRNRVKARLVDEIRSLRERQEF